LSLKKLDVGSKVGVVEQGVFEGDVGDGNHCGDTLSCGRTWWNRGRIKRYSGWHSHFFVNKR
jgi:hypothetical protein